MCWLFRIFVVIELCKADDVREATASSDPIQQAFQWFGILLAHILWRIAPFNIWKILEMSVP